MRIVVISTPFVSVPPRDYGGTELIVDELVEGLVDRGHEITLFGTGDSSTRATLCSIYVKAQWPPSPLTEVNHVSWALSQIMEGEFDLIHTHSAIALGMTRLLPEMPIVYTLHHEQVQEFSDFYRFFPNVHYIAISQNQRKLEISLPHCEVIYHGLDPDRFECADVADDYVCYIGRFSEVKGPHIAIDVARDAGLPIRVAGRTHPPDQEFAAREVEPRLSLSNVKYVGCIGVSQKIPLLRQARAFLAPLQWEEPFGLTMIEAMLSGCPVVAFPRGSAPELIEPGITGFLAKSPGQMVELVRRGGAIESINRRKCRQRAIERFSRERFVDDHLRLYERVIAESRVNHEAPGKTETCPA
jgi:glycosyltransferase involved in cell wall biosynthesis